MSTLELRDLEEARRFLVQGLWLQKVLTPAAAGVRPALEWALEIAAGDHPLPPIGFVADLGSLAFGLDREEKTGHEVWAIPDLPAGLARTYEDHVLGKVFADTTFDRARDALCQYQGRDRARGLAFLINQFRERAGFQGVLLSPAVIKTLLDAQPEMVLGQGAESLQGEGLHPLFPVLYESLVQAARRTAEVLGPEDVFELEHGTALARLGERIALRQVLQAADHLEARLPPYRVRTPGRRREVHTHIRDEDTYPVGGFASLSNRGSIESLLHSQLAYMEQEERPDLFDIKFLRDELLYYARDDNQFLRGRRTFVLALYPDLVQSRFKDADLPWQRGILLLALLLVTVRKLAEWLSTDALTFEFLFVLDREEDVLKPERELLGMLLREQILNGTVKLARVTGPQVVARCMQAARRSLCHCLVVSTADRSFQADRTIVTRLKLNGPCPALHVADEEPVRPEVESALEGWGVVLERLLQGLV